ncbi:uncharacterized protein FOMMEDRAFT_27178 [Fomitiporia mediterranea MF3/22]|uniref:uncharacterized protein n=1 Tax=Fomitiporia mediterranea (strain MF3/22) TaxID=694068 RepID=UPI000440761C|nr:uncharacterized protein FOMMEDRAFT_27178 [Fomitiporia mediterranea MF3/22]EJD04886.1 hypothetical protein FOMMEDRAFT_27178 [Fomitiporia mediterranea MF3/22]
MSQQHLSVSVLSKRCVQGRYLFYITINSKREKHDAITEYNGLQAFRHVRKGAQIKGLKIQEPSSDHGDREKVRASRLRGVGAYRRREKRCIFAPFHGTCGSDSNYNTDICLRPPTVHLSFIWYSSLVARKSMGGTRYATSEMKKDVPDSWP